MAALQSRRIQHLALVHWWLVLTVVIAGLLVATVLSAQAQTPENPQQSSLGVGGDVPGPPPDTAATINVPINGQVFTSTPVAVSGTCEAGRIVEIYKNEIFGGATECTSSSTYQVEVDLFIGENDLVARIRDLLGQAGPDSPVTRVVYEPAVTGTGRPLPEQQLLLSTSATFRGGSPGSEFSFPMTLSGGIGPYAISVVWGDGGSDVISRSDTGSFSASHTYDRPGVYRVVTKATDESQSVAFLQTVAVVNGEPVAGTGRDEDAGPVRTTTQYVTWPLFGLVSMLPAAFWVGMHYQRYRTLR